MVGSDGARIDGMASTSGHPSGADAKSHNMVDWLLLLLPGCIWGASFLLIAEGLDALSPDGVTFARFLIGFATLSVVPAARRPVRPEDRVGIAWLGVLWMALPMSMFPHAEQYVSSAVTGMLNGAIPLVAASVAAVTARQVPSRTMTSGLMVGSLGTTLIALPGVASDANHAFAVGLIALAVLSYGVAINLARPLQLRNGALPVVWRALGVAVILTAPFGSPALLKGHWSGRSLVAVVALGGLGTAIANVVMATAAGRLGPTRASATTFLIPVVALVLGVLVRGEHVAHLAVVGGGLCLAGAALMRRTNTRSVARGPRCVASDAAGCVPRGTTP